MAITLKDISKKSDSMSLKEYTKSQENKNMIIDSTDENSAVNLKGPAAPRPIIVNQTFNNYGEGPQIASNYGNITSPN